MLLCLFDRQLNGLHGHHGPKIPTTIQHRRGCRFSTNGKRCSRVDFLVEQVIHIPHDADDAVRIEPHQVGIDQHVGHEGGFVGRSATGGEDALSDLAKSLMGEIVHAGSSLAMCERSILANILPPPEG